MTRLASAVLLFVIGLLPSAVLLPAATPEPVRIAALPMLRSGVPAYPVPFLAVARTPYTIAPLAGRVIDIQTDFGYPAGFSGLVDTAIGSIGYPGYRNFSNLDIAYDAEKLCLLVCVPYPFGRKTRADATEPSAELLADDVFEVLIDPRDEQGRSKGPVYRIVGNAGGVCEDRSRPASNRPAAPGVAGGGEVRQHDVGPHGKLDGRRTDPLPRPRRGAARRTRLGLPSRNPLRRSQNHRRALAGRRFHRSLPLRPGALRRGAEGQLSLPLARTRTRSSRGPSASAASSATAAMSRRGSTGA